MATNSIPTAELVAKGSISTAYMEGSLSIENLYLDAERISETAFGLACSQAYDSGAQAAFYAIGQLAECLSENARKASEHLTDCAKVNREAAQ